jgi:acetyltransferase-like isoleucine patch superfamily enzyme
MVTWLKDHLSDRHKQVLADWAYLPFRLRDRIYCILVGLPYDSSWRFHGMPRIRLRSQGSIIIGVGFTAVSRWSRNTIGVIQPVVIRTLTPSARIVIGENVGISGSTISAKEAITIGDNVIIGSGCIISDSDAHALEYEARMAHVAPATAPIHIGEGAFIGARSIILKGVTIGARSVIGAGTVVVRDIPPNCIAAGNPAKPIRSFN